MRSANTFGLVSTLLIGIAVGSPRTADAQCDDTPGNCGGDYQAPPSDIPDPGSPGNGIFGITGNDVGRVAFFVSVGGKKGFELISGVKIRASDVPSVQVDRSAEGTQLGHDRGQEMAEELGGWDEDRVKAYGQSIQPDPKREGVYTGALGRSMPAPTGSSETTENMPSNPAITDGEITGSDPVNPSNGELHLAEVDLQFPGFGVAFRQARTYRSRVDFVGPMGFGWDHAYNQRIIETRSDSCVGEVLYMTGL